MKKRRYASVLMTLILLAGSMSIVPSRSYAAQMITVDPGIEYQTVDGWGTNLVWWAGQIGTWEDPVRREIMDLIFGEEGLGLNMIRYNFGGSSTDPSIDSSMHPARKMPSRAVGYNESAGQILYDHETVDQGQEWVIKDLVNRYNVNYMEAQVNSPPWWMTVSGSAAGNVGATEENLAPEKYDLYVQYLIDMLKHFKDSDGIDFDHIDPFNEPVSGYWKKGGNQEGAYFSPAVQQIIIRKLHQRLQEEGLTTQIAASDETSIDHTIATYKSFDQATQDMISRIQTHVYSGSKRYQLRDLALGENKPLWMSEISTGYEPYSREGMQPAIPLANTIFKDIKDMGVSGWIVWQAVEDRVENYINLNQGPDYLKPWGTPGSWGLINADYSDLDLSAAYGPDYTFSRGHYEITKQYYVMKQFSKFIKQGYRIIDANSGDVVAALGPDGRLVLVVSNFSGGAKSLSFDLSKFSGHAAAAQGFRTSDTEAAEQIADTAISGTLLNVTLPANSLTTYVVENSDYEGPKSRIINDNVLGDSANSFHYSEGWSYYDGQIGNYANDTHYANQTGSKFDLPFSGNRVKLYGALSGDSGIAAVSIDGGNPVEVDLYSSIRKDNALLFDSGVLEEDGHHKVTVTVTGLHNDHATDGYVAFDRAVVTTGDWGDIAPSPVITSITSKDSGLDISFEGVERAERYLVKYGLKSGKYTYTTIVTGPSAQLKGLSAGAKYYAVVAAVVDGKESLPSQEVSATYEAKPAGEETALAYYVDAGATSLVPGLPLGDYNTSMDQPYGTDPITGYKWGWISDLGTGVSSAGDRFKSVRYSGSGSAGQGFSYKFELPDGKYRVQLGFSDPWGNSKRFMDIKLQGVERTTEYVAPAYPATDVKTYPAVSVTDGMLQIDVVRSAINTTAYTDPLISWIRIDRYDVAAVPGKPYISEVNTTVANQAVVSIIEGSGADYYKIKYGTLPGQYTQETTLASGLSKNLVNLAAGTTYYFTVVGVNTYGEGEPADEITAITMPESVSTDTMYYTVLGASSLPAGQSYGLLQGPVIDPKQNLFAADDVTGYTWGVVNRSQIDGAWETGPYGGFGYTNNKTAGQGINYAFELPNGQYDVSLGFYDPWGVTNRNMDILINGMKVGMENALTSGTKTYTGQTVIDGKMTVDVVNPTPTQNVSPGFSMITIKMTRGLAVNRKTLDLEAGDTFILGTKVMPDSMAALPIEWTSSDESVVTVENGVIHAIQAGAATIQAAVQGHADLTASTVVTVTNAEQSTVPVSGVILDRQQISEKGTARVTAAVSPLNASVQELIWTTDDPEVASVETVSSDIYAADITVHKPGRAIIRATSAADPTKYAVARVNVPSAADTILLNADLVTLAAGEEAALKASVKPDDAILGEAVWQSSDTQVATVDQNGVIKAVANGTSTVTVSTGGVSSSAVITVRTPVTDVNLQPAAKSIAAGSDFTLTAGIEPADASQTELIWTSDKPSIANVDGNGIVHGYKPGTVKITVTTVDGYRTASSVITVLAKEDDPKVPVTGIIVNPERRAITVNQSFTAVATVSPSNADDRSVIWSSGNPEVASVDATGKVTGHKAGSTVITASVAGGKYKAELRVNVSNGNQSPPLNPPLPNQQAPVKRELTVKEEALKPASGADSVVVEFDGSVQQGVEIRIPANAAELVEGKPLELAGGKLTIVIPSKLLEQLRSRLPGDKLKGAEIALTIQQVTQAQSDVLLARAEMLSGAGIKSADSMYEFKLAVVQPDGAETPVTSFAEPIQLSFKIDPNADPSITGIYNIGEDGMPEYVGGTRKGDRLTANITHFSKYAMMEYSKTFSDLPEGHWAYESVRSMAARQIVYGVDAGRFAPAQDVTRAAFTSMIAHALGLQKGSITDRFTDVPSGVWYADEVAAALEAGIVTGRQDTLFAPNERITREEIAVLLMRAYVYAAGQESSMQVPAYSDNDRISSWAKDAVSKASSLKLLQGSQGQFRPKAFASRAESAQAIFNLLKRTEA